VKALVLAALLVGASPPATSLKVTYWPHGRSAAATTWTLACAPAKGTHPARGRACLALKTHPLDVGPAQKPCTIMAVVGAPEAQIVGTVDGQKVNRSYRDGCPGWSDLHVVLTGG
jgi:hypothetical protein